MFRKKAVVPIRKKTRKAKAAALTRKKIKKTKITIVTVKLRQSRASCTA